MSKINKLKITLEISSSEMMEHEGNILIRCQRHRSWIPLTDYYSEVNGSLLPLVGNVTCSDKCGWEETVRIVEKKEGEPEGGVLSFNATDGVSSKEKFG